MTKYSYHVKSTQQFCAIVMKIFIIIYSIHTSSTGILVQKKSLKLTAVFLCGMSSLLFS